MTRHNHNLLAHQSTPPYVVAQDCRVQYSNGTPAQGRVCILLAEPESQGPWLLLALIRGGDRLAGITAAWAAFLVYARAVLVATADRRTRVGYSH